MKNTKNQLSNLKNHKNYERVLYWGKNISITGIAQLLVQGVGFISGILIIRLLPVNEYALYTIANTMLGTMTILSDAGISSGVMAQGGKVWKDPKKLGIVVATGLELRRKFAIGSIIVTSPILIYLLLKNGSTWLTALLIFLSLIPAFYVALSNSIYRIAPSLHQSILPLQKNDVSVGLLRLLIIGSIVFIFPFASMAIIASGIPGIYGNIKLKKISNAFLEESKQSDGEVKKEILKGVKKIMPGAIYYSLSSQITIWLISFFGSSTNVAQLGVLGRFAVVFTMLTSLVTTLLVPRFARSALNKKGILNKFIQLQGILFGLSLVMIAIFYIFNFQILWILGNEYRDLKMELLLISISGAIGFISSNTNTILASRSIIVPPIIFISSAIIIQIIAGVFLPLDQVSGVIQFSIYTVLMIYLVRISYLIYYVKKYDAL